MIMKKNTTNYIKKIVSFTLVLIVLCVTLLSAGCSSENSDKTESDKSNKPIVFNTPASTPLPTPTSTPEPTPTPFPDFEAPVLYGVVKRQFYVGEAISYLSGVFATDNIDTDVEITVDRSAVDTKKAGTYDITYTAKDDAGNTTSQSTTITLSEVKVTEEALHQVAQEVLSEITTADMTLEEKLWAIYKYTNNHLTYWNSSDKDDWRAEAYRGITTGFGDCFTYFSVCQILFDEIGAEYLPVRRQGGVSRHFWHMVKTSQGWYHFDTCIHRPIYNSFLRTDAELDAYTQQQEIYNPGYNYFTYDKTGYPSVSEIPFEWDRDSYKNK